MSPMMLCLCVLVTAVVVIHGQDLTELLKYSRSDRVIYDIKTQAKCFEIARKPTRNCVWPAGLNSFADQIGAGGRIVAYKIRWFSGKWSGWFVPGVNDLGWKFNPSGRKCVLPYKANSMRRAWAYFFDHTHIYIICKAR